MTRCYRLVCVLLNSHVETYSQMCWYLEVEPLGNDLVIRSEPSSIGLVLMRGPKETAPSPLLLCEDTSRKWL